jgi:hypothetical protein
VQTTVERFLEWINRNPRLDWSLEEAIASTRVLITQASVRLFGVAWTAQI